MKVKAKKPRPILLAPAYHVEAFDRAEDRWFRWHVEATACVATRKAQRIVMDEGRPSRVVLVSREVVEVYS